jgi:PAS domain S-box-containing protein
MTATPQDFAGSLGLLDHVSDAVISTDVDLSIRTWNKSAERIYGWTAAESLGQNLHQWLKTQFVSGTDSEAQARLESQGFFEMELMQVDRQGRELFIRARVAQMRDPQGVVVGTVGLFQDVTDYKHAEQALRASEERFRSLYENSTLGLYRTTPDGLILLANPALVKMLGFSSFAELSRRNLESTGYEQGYHRAEFKRQIEAEGEVKGLEACWIRLDGTPIYVRESARAIRDATGQVLYYEGTVEDITQRKLAEMERRKLSQAVEQSPASIVITDRNGAIEYVNPKFTRLTGYTLEEVRGQNPRVLKGERTSGEEYSRLWETISRGDEWHGEFQNRKKSGELYWELASISPILDEQGRITHFLAVKEDVTERKLLEEHLRQAQKMEAIGQLAGGVAHDFNNILASILLHLGLLKQDPSLDPATQQSLNELIRESQRGANLVRQLLMFSRRSLLEVKRLDPNDLVLNLLKMLKRLIGEHIELQFSPNLALPPIQADPGMIEQVIVNLCVNARDAMPKGGRLRLELTLVEADAARTAAHPPAAPGPFVCLSVSDTGCGIAPANLEHIFEPFFTTKEAGKGTGLGLATVDGIAAQHKGWVEVESTPGQGSTFRVYLPATARGPVQTSILEQTRLQRGTESILLAEDEDSLRRVASQCLRLLGYKVLEAANGGEALRIWEEHHGDIQLLITDMVMPGGLTGLDLGVQLRARDPNLKVIICTGYSAEMATQGAPLDRAFVCVQKPYQLDAVSRVIRECLDRK